MANELKTPTSLEVGTPPPQVAHQNDLLFEGARGALPDPPAPKEVPVETFGVLEPPVADASQALLRRLGKADSTITLVVNGVEFTMDAVDVSITELSVCCLVRIGGMRCRIPRSQDVCITLDGKTFHTAFLGSWHTLEWLGVHIVVFPVIRPEEPA